MAGREERGKISPLLATVAAQNDMRLLFLVLGEFMDIYRG